jgi:hypothetical protein
MKGAYSYELLDSGVPVTENEWTHIALVQNGAQVDIYVDGMSENSVSNGAAPALSNPPNAVIGAYMWWGHHPGGCFNGSIDEVRIYDRALSAEEIQQLYQNGMGELIGLEITGPDEVAENFQAQYTAIAYYDNNSTRDVTDLAQWSVEPNTIVSIEAGLLQTEEIYEHQDITIYAQYTEGEVTVDAEKAVSVFAVCPSGSALDFDGQGDYVDVPSLTTLNSPFSVSVWAKMSDYSDGTYPTIVGKWIVRTHRQFVLSYHDASDVIYAHLFDDSDDSHQQVISTYQPPLDVWFNAVLTYNGTHGKIYINGVLNVTQEAVGDYLNDVDVDVGIGARSDGSGAFFNGAIDDVCIYNRALSAEEIQANMYMRLTGNEPNLVAYWDFDEGEGQIAYDMSPNGNNGQLGSAPTGDGSDPAWVDSDAPISICIPVDVDIKPQSCPNPLNVSSKGVLPVAILGSESFDVSTIVATSVRLAGVEPIRDSYEDVAAPFADANECECATDGPDGYLDLTLKFNTLAIVNALGEVTDGDVLPLTLTAVLLDETTIEGADCIVVRGKFKPLNKADFNKDGVVDIVDFAIIAESWLQSSFVED